MREHLLYSYMITKDESPHNYGSVKKNSYTVGVGNNEFRL